MSAPIGLPFAHLNLRRNPFGELTPAERVAVMVPAFDLEPLALHLRTGRAAVQLIGACGRGKTTHLLALAQQLGGAPLLRAAPDERPPALPRARPLAFDEVQLLPPRLRRQLFRGGGPLLLGTHEDYAPELRRWGLSVRTVHVTGLTAERLLAVVRRRIEHVRRAPGPVPRLSDASAQVLLRRFGDDLRATLHHLYEQLQRQREPGDVQV